MNRLRIERRPRAEAAQVAADLSRDLLTQPLYGRYAIVCDHPAALEATTTKQWQRQIRRVMARRKAADDVTTIIEASNQISRMQNLVFAAAPPADLLEADVLFASAAEFEQAPPMCDVLIVAAPVEQGTLDKLTRYMQDDGRVVLYG